MGLVRMVDGYGVENLTTIIVELPLHKGGLIEEEMGQRLVCFGTDGHPNFQGCANGVATQFQKGYSPYLITIQCVAHWTSLVAGDLSNLLILSTLEDFV